MISRYQTTPNSRNRKEGNRKGKGKGREGKGKGREVGMEREVVTKLLITICRLGINWVFYGGIVGLDGDWGLFLAWAGGVVVLGVAGGDVACDLVAC
jgi:hypothetical protein